MIKMTCQQNKATKEMVKSGRIEIITNYPGCEVGFVVHDVNCPNCPPEFVEKAKNGFNHDAVKGYTQNNCHKNCRDREPIYMEITHINVVLSTGEHNFYDDSDFYALIWDETTQTVREVEYASTRGWTYPNCASVDATPDVVAKANNHYRTIAFDKWKANNEMLAKIPHKGKFAKVIKGRKVPIGTTGEIIWYGTGKKYNYNDKPSMRVGIKDNNNAVHWTDANNVEVLHWEKYLPANNDFAYYPKFKAA